MKEDIQQLKEKEALANNAETLHLTGFLAVFRWAEWALNKGGIYTLLFMPLIDIYRAYNYWQQTQYRLDHDEPPTMIYIGRTLMCLKAVISTVGITFALLGSFMIGFGLLTASGLANTCINIGKAIQYGIKALTAPTKALRDHFKRKAFGKLEQVAVGLSIGVGFIFLTFVPGLNAVGWTLAFAAACYLTLRLAKSVFFDSPKPNSGDDVAQKQPKSPKKDNKQPRGVTLRKLVTPHRQVLKENQRRVVPEKEKRRARRLALK